MLMAKTKNNWYQLDHKEVLKRLNSSEQGLTDTEVKARQKKYGQNTLPAAIRMSPLQIFINQFKDVLIGVLLAAATVSLLLGFYEEHKVSTEAVLIYAIVVAIAFVGFLNEYRAEKTVESLKKLLAFKARVRRNNRVVEVDAKNLVPGDIMLIEEGQKIPADARLLHVEELQVNEASLTGESKTSSKNTKVINSAAALGDQANMIFSGTHSAAGTALAIVTAIGKETEIGKIASLVDSVENEATPMQRKLDALGKKLGLIVLILCVIIFIITFFFDKQHESSTLLSRSIFAFTAAVALAVAAIPEGLAFVVRISLALGARRMAKKKALVRKLSAVEALGSTDVICSDKTGTLTKGEMTVRKIWVDGRVYNFTGEGYTRSGELQDESGKAIKASESIKFLLTIGSLCNNADLKSDNGIIGDSTEAALLISTEKAGLHYQKLQEEYERIKELPFNSGKKMMTTIHQDGKHQLVAVKGAPDVVLAQASRILINGKVLPLTEERRKAVLAQNSLFAKDALRVLAFATKEQKTMPKNTKNIEKDLIFVGLQAMIDPPRREVSEVIDRVQTEAGMRVVMITGDHIETAKAIAKELRITGEAISGMELDKLTQEEFENKVEHLSVYARVNPEHKIRIVRALKKNGRQVAMTGDGVNDAPAIKAADIGIAMGITGTDVTKEAADLILLDDQFLTIITAIEEGRGIFDNVRKFVNFLLSANIAEVLTILAGIIFARKLLLSPAQILFINIITDGLPAIALGSDPAAKNIMRHVPNKYQESIVNLRTWIEIVVFGMIMTAALLLIYNNTDAKTAVAVVFTGMVIFEMARLVDIRTDYKIRWLSNPMLTVALIASLLLQVAVIHTPVLAKLFQVNSLQLKQWLLLAGVSVVLVIIMKLLNKPLEFFGKEN